MKPMVSHAWSCPLLVAVAMATAAGCGPAGMAPRDAAGPGDGGSPDGPANIAMEIFAAPDGGGAACTMAAPCSLAGAQGRARALAGTLDGDLVVNLRGGTYRLTEPFRLDPSDSGRPGTRVVYQAYRDEQPIWSGAIRITGFTPFDAGRNVWRAPLPAGTASRQLFVDGLRAERPHTQRGSLRFTPTARGLASIDPITAPLQWSARPGLEVMQDNAWKHMRCAVDRIEATTDLVPLRRDDGSAYPTPSSGGITLVVEPRCYANNMLQVPHPGYPFNGSGLPRLEDISTIENVFELLGAPGQFYLDAQAGFVYYVPRPGEDLATADVELPVLEALLEVRGTPGHLAPRNDDDDAATYSTGWQRATVRGQGDLLDDAHTTSSSSATATFRFTGTGVDVLGQVNVDGAALDVTVTRVSGGAPVASETVSTSGPVRLAQQVLYEIANLPKDDYQITIKKHASDATTVVIDGFVVLSEPLATVHDVAFRGISFAHATWTQPSRDGYVDNQAGVLWDPVKHTPIRIPGAVRVSRGQRLDFSGNAFEHMGGAGLELGDGTQDTTVVGNRFDDISAGAILAGEIDDYYLHERLPTGPARMTSGLTISNNAITNTGIDYHDTVALWVGNARSSTLAHNLIAHTSYSGISLGWGWGWVAPCDRQAQSNTTTCRRGTSYNGGNRIVANRIYDVMRTLIDGGPIYTLGEQAVVGGVAPTVAGNVVSNAVACFHMIYHDEGSSYWQTHDNVVYATGCHWLGIWMPTAHDIHAGVASANYTDNPQGASDFGTDDRIEHPVLMLFAAWPEAARAIERASGLEAPYRALVAPVRVINDGDAAVRYSSDAANPQWGTNGFRGFGDVGDDVHYAQANGAIAQLTFTGTGVEVLGEKNGDQGTVEIFLDGQSRGTVDTSVPAGAPRLAQQVLFAAHGLSAGPHTVAVVKRSGQYATVDGFWLDDPVSPITGEP